MARRRPRRKLFGDYVPSGLLARGGQAEVWSATHRVTGEVAALKLLPKDMANDASERRFRRELRALTHLRHENIVSVLQVAEEDDVDLWYVMELADQGTLRTRLESDSWPLHERLEALRQVCMGVAYAHSQGVIHRDLKPDNVLCFGSETPRTYKVADFGVVKRRGLDTTTITTTKDVVGTMVYWSPEHYRNPSLVDKRSDIYTLGVIYYELVRGERPLVLGRNPDEIAQDLDRPYSTLIPLLLSSKPEARLQSAEQVAEALESLLRGESQFPGGEGLSPIEREVVRLGSLGLQDRQIGSALGISEVVVTSHLVSVQRKFGVGSRQDLLRLIGSPTFAG